MMVAVTNLQRGHPVNRAQIGRLARRAMRRLRISGRGTLAITFIAPAAMRRLHKRFLRDGSMTDVITFRYPGEPVAGELLIAPAAARAWAARHGVPYAQELSRYVVHGLLHWKGYNDRTPAQRLQMRKMENHLLQHCGFRVLVNGCTSVPVHRYTVHR